MKILCIADIHGDVEGVKKAGKYAEKNGIKDILILGDFPGHGVFNNIVTSMEQIRIVLGELKGFKVMAIPGNCDPQNSSDLFEEYRVNLHEKVLDIAGVKIIGFGGSNITPFGTPSEYSENEIYERLKKLMPEKSGKTILAVHCPPMDTNCDRTGNEMHAGCSAIRRIIEEFQPDLCVCSHIHEAGGSIDRIGETTVANIGRLGNSLIGVIDIGKSIEIALESMPQ
ncbi:MAG: metallophosphoesterase [Chloroflexi bacterium]|nr:metallophosphoesterase [Chloroflexota bacterium]